MKFTHYKTRTNAIFLEEKHDESYDSIIRRNGGEVQERTLADFYTTQTKEVYRQFAKVLG